MCKFYPHPTPTHLPLPQGIREIVRFSSKIHAHLPHHRRIWEPHSLYQSKVNFITRRSCGSNPFPAIEKGTFLSEIRLKRFFFCAKMNMGAKRIIPKDPYFTPILFVSIQQIILINHGSFVCITTVIFFI